MLSLVRFGFARLCKMNVFYLFSCDKFSIPIALAAFFLREFVLLFLGKGGFSEDPIAAYAVTFLFYCLLCSGTEMAWSRAVTAATGIDRS